MTIGFKDRSGRIHSPKRKGESGGQSSSKSNDSFQPKRSKKNRASQDFKKNKKDKTHPAPARKTPLHKMTTLKASVDKNRKGFAFLSFGTDEYEDLFIPPRDATHLFHGDRVEVTISPDGEVIELKVLEHRFTEVFGRYTPHPSGKLASGGWVVYERKKAREEIFLPAGGLKAKSGDWVRAKLTFHEHGSHSVTGEVVDVYGPILPASIDVEMIAGEFNLIETHPKDAEDEAKQIKFEIDEWRTDLQHVPFITIDGETARDFDDAIYVEREKSGYVLWVAIADVSHYVTPGSAIDKDALSRGTSVYFPERAFHMLPRALSEGLCSLRPNEPRLTMVSKIYYNHSGEIVKTELIEAVIKSHRRATYTEIQAEIEQNKSKKDWDFKPQFELYQLLRKVRSARGSIDFDLPETEVWVDETGEPTKIFNRTRLDAHRLIEEFMIAANEAVTEWIMAKNWPFIFRVHEEPSEQSLINFQKLAATAGVNIRIHSNDLNSALADFVSSLDDHPASFLLNMALLRAMRQANYSSVHGIHFGLASRAYTHFTSPIRRYPDLVVHRLLRRALRAENKRGPSLRGNERDALERELEEIAEHCSYRERLASDADREAIKLKQARFMHHHIGDEFDGKVIGMIERGFFVRLEDPFVEGMVNKDNMTDDFYEWNEERMIFYGKRKRKTFKIGQPIRVRVLAADLDQRTIDFGIVEPS